MLRSPLRKGGPADGLLTATVESLVKEGLKKVMKGKKPKRNCAYDSSSSDSDSK